MGDNLFDPRYAEFQQDHRHHLSASTRPTESVHQHIIVNGEEEPYTIKCICGFIDDDGNTVLCEQCNTWQHIECYYHPTLVVPDVHQCTDCFPRVLDSFGAAQRQRLHREPVNITDDRRVKRTTNKGQKRVKVREQSGSSLQQNGFNLHDQSGLDGRNGLSWDQPPPSKRPKTTHRNSTSISSSKPLGPRDMNGLQEIFYFRPPKIPLSECPPTYFSEEFIRLHRDSPDFAVAQANTHSSIHIANLLATWLDDVDAFATATQGKSQADVLAYFPHSIEDLEAPIQQHMREDTDATFHGQHPIWKYLTIDRDTAAGEMVGEIRGTIGHLEEYIAEPSNDWNRLRHPDHFVFFHPTLPLFIDCRREGTLLRYARRSCKPNMKIETLITGEREYRFCFTALEDIPRGAEITVGWDLRFHPELRDSVSSAFDGKKISPEEKLYLQNSIAKILAHFGDCACAERDDQPCLMGRFDHRLAAAAPESLPQVPKLSRKRKSLKRSPPRALADLNSRAGSESVAQDDDNEDSRSASRSTRSKTSRENTPITSASRDIIQALGPELSERDKKKLIQEEMLFNKLEQEKQNGPRKKKRNSGSNVNTPAVSNPKQQGRRNSVTSNNNTSAAWTKSGGTDHTSSYFPGRHSPFEQSPQPQGGGEPRKPTASKPFSLPKPVYVSRGIQTGSDDHNVSTPNPISTPRTFMPLVQRILRRSHFRANNPPTAQSPKSIPQSFRPQTGAIETSITTSDSAIPAEISVNMARTTGEDVEMKETESPEHTIESASTERVNIGEAEVTTSSTSQQPLQSQHPPLNPPPPPWSATQGSGHPPPPPARTNIRSANLHVDLPPPMPTGQGLEMPISNTPLTFTPGVILGGFNQPSASVPPIPTPSTFGSMSASFMTQPSPLKKKMSLSDYTAKMKAKTPSVEKSQGLVDSGGSSPSSTKQSVMPLGSAPGDQNETRATGAPLKSIHEDDWHV